jgi:hypothetical protein
VITTAVSRSLVVRSVRFFFHVVFLLAKRIVLCQWLHDAGGFTAVSALADQGPEARAGRAPPLLRASPGVKPW